MSRENAQVAELADALGSGPSVRKGRGGSSPLLGTLVSPCRNSHCDKGFFFWSWEFLVLAFV